MFSDLARTDLDELRSKGLEPTYEDIVRLNALGLKVSDGEETTAFNTPRWATAGGVIFWEPTLAARFWFEYAKHYADDENVEDWMFAFACAHGKDAKYLEELRAPNEIESALGRFLAGLTATKSEVERAVCFAAVGHDYVKAEKTALAAKHEKDWTPEDRERKNLENLEELLATAATSTGLDYLEILAQTPSRLRGMIYAAHVQAGMTMTKSAAKANADYLATLSAIEKRLRAEKEAAAANVASADR